jgi:epoxyqueuosine reductase
MGYLERGQPSFADLRDWKPWVRGALLFALPYARAAGGFRGGGRVARYALGRDYHHVLGRRLQKLGRALRARGICSRYRAVVDAAPVLEREWAIRGAVGFRGKNTLLLHPRHGPWVLLGELLLDADMPAWAPPPDRTADCGSCTRCLDACPTRAFDAAYLLDPRRCISYLTIEARGPIPPALRPALGDWVFGCDVCLEVCPFGAHAGDFASSWSLHPALTQLRLEDLPTLTPEVFNRLFTGSPLRRAGSEGMARNAVVVLGNLGRGGEALAAALAGHPSPLVRGHAAWALGRQRGSRSALETAVRDPAPEVAREAAAALEAWPS